MALRVARKVVIYQAEITTVRSQMLCDFHEAMKLSLSAVQSHPQGVY